MKATIWDNIRQSLYNIFDHALLENGGYINIVTGQKDIHTNDLSRFYPVSDSTLFPGSASGHIFQSSFHNFVYESGVSQTPPPTVISGVYVDGIFVPKGPMVHIDYINGRVIFNNPISTSSVVQGAFSYKEYSFVSPDNTNPFKDKTLFKENSKFDNVAFPASPDLIYLPAILLEMEYATEKGFQLGGTHETQPEFKLTIVSASQAQVESLASVLCSFSTKSIPIVDVTLGPKFDFYKDLSENYSFSAWCSQSQNYGYVKSVNYNRFYDLNSENIEPSLFGGILTVNILAIR